MFAHYASETGLTTAGDEVRAELTTVDKGVDWCVCGGGALGGGRTARACPTALGNELVGQFS